MGEGRIFDSLQYYMILLHSLNFYLTVGNLETLRMYVGEHAGF